MQILIPEAVYFDLTEKDGSCVELWAATWLRNFKTTLSGVTVFFEFNGQERDFGGNRILQGFNSRSMTQTERVVAEGLYPEVRLVASLKRIS